MKQRSPVLGYNHNVRYAGRLWHVQTEDSGVNNPHIFTHLFHEGTILATKRIDYDPSSEVGIVQKLMQAQHKAMLRDVKAGAFDDKIARFFGAPVVHDREDQTDPGAAPLSGEFDAAPKTDPSMHPPRTPSQESVPIPPAAPPPRVAAPAQPPARTASSAANVPRPMGGTQSRPNLTPSRPAIPVAASRPGTPSSPANASPRPAVSGIGGRRSPPSSGAHAYGGG